MSRHYGISRSGKTSAVKNLDLSQSASSSSLFFTIPADDLAYMQSKAWGGTPYDSPETCHEAYDVIAQWFDSINAELPAFTSAIASVENDSLSGNLQTHFNQKGDELFLNSQEVRIAAYGSASGSQKGIADLISNDDLQTSWDLFALFGEDTFNSVLAVSQQLSGSTENVGSEISYLKGYFANSLDLGTPHQLSLATYEFLVDPGGVESAGYNHPTTDSAQYHQRFFSGPPSALILNEHALLGSGGWYGLINASKYDLTEYLDQAIAELEGLISGAGYADGTSKAVFTGLIWLLEYAEEELAGLEPENWWDWLQTVGEWLYNLFDWSALAQDLILIIVADYLEPIVTSAKNANIGLKEILYQKLPSALLQLTSGNYNPDSSLLASYYAMRKQKLEGPWNAISAALTRTTDINNALAILDSCWYYNCTLYFYKHGWLGNGNTPRDPDAFDDYLQWLAEQEQAQAIFEQWAPQQEMLQQGTQIYRAEEMQPQLQLEHRDLLRHDLQEMMTGEYLKDIVGGVYRQQRPLLLETLPWVEGGQRQQTRKGSQKRKLGGILPVKREALFPLILAGLVFSAYLGSKK